MKCLRLQQSFQEQLFSEPLEAIYSLAFARISRQAPKMFAGSVKGRFYSSDTAYVHGGHM